MTIIFSDWSNKLYMFVDAPLHRIDCARSYAEYEHKSQFQPSAQLSADAKRYEDLFLGGKNRLAIMLRVERTVYNYLNEQSHFTDRTQPQTLNDCFNEVLSSSQAILKDAKGLKPVVTIDIFNTSGTDTYIHLPESVKELSTKTLMALYNNTWSLKEWSDSFSQVVSRTGDKSYRAALEKTLASRADCLIVMGGGSFQAQAVQEYLDYHRSSGKKCVSLVCVMTESNTEVQKTLRHAP